MKKEQPHSTREERFQERTYDATRAALATLGLSLTN
jgi:hypothetical protein